MAPAPLGAQAPIEGELTLITPVSKFIHDAALKAFADYAKEKWNVTVKTNAIPAGTPVAYGRIVEWKGKPDADIFWGGESALFEKLAEQKLLQKVEISKEAWDSIPGLDRQAQAHPAQGQGRLLDRHRARAVRARLPPRRVQRLGLAEPKDWDDLLDPKLKGEVAQCAPTRSSSSNATYEVILSMYGEDKGWDWLKRLAANTGHFTARSRDVPTVVAKGEFAAGFAVPSYMAFEEKLAGFDLKFVAPKNAFVTPEPMAILAGARNPKAARAFIEFLLTERGQSVFMERGLFPITPKYKVQGPPGSTAELAVRVHRRRALLLRRRGRQRLRRGRGGQALGGAQDAVPLGHRGRRGTSSSSSAGTPPPPRRRGSWRAGVEATSGTPCHKENGSVRELIGLLSLCLVVAAAAPAEAQSPLERGRYLVEVLGACGNCHTPKGPEGTCPGKHLAGGFEMNDGSGLGPRRTSRRIRDRHRPVDGRGGDSRDPRGPRSRRPDARPADALRHVSTARRQRRQGDGGVPPDGEAGAERGGAKPVHDPAAPGVRSARGDGAGSVPRESRQVRRIPRGSGRALHGVPHAVSPRGHDPTRPGSAPAGSASAARGG